MPFEDVVRKAARATVIVRIARDPNKKSCFATGFVVGQVMGLCIVMTIGHYIARGSEEIFEVIYFDHIDEIFTATILEHLPESEVLLLIVKKRDDSDCGRLDFESKDGWDLSYLQKLVAVSHPCFLEWRAALGIVNCPEFLNTTIGNYDSKMILFDHSLQLAVGSSGAALLNEGGNVVGIQSGELAATYITMSGKPIADALDSKRLSTRDLPFDCLSLYLSEIVCGYEHLHVIKTIPCSLKQAVHVKYIDDVIRKCLKKHFTIDIENVGLNDLLEEYVSINPFGSQKRNIHISRTSSHPYSVVPSRTTSQLTCSRPSSQLTCARHSSQLMYDTLLRDAVKVDETALINEYVPGKTVQQRLALYQEVTPIYMSFSDGAEKTFADSSTFFKDQGSRDGEGGRTSRSCAMW